MENKDLKTLEEQIRAREIALIEKEKVEKQGVMLEVRNEIDKQYEVERKQLEEDIDDDIFAEEQE